MEAFEAQLGDGGQEEFRAERMEVMSRLNKLRWDIFNKKFGTKNELLINSIPTFEAVEQFQQKYNGDHYFLVHVMQCVKKLYTECQEIVKGKIAAFDAAATECAEEAA